AWVLPSELFSALPEVLDFCPAALSGAWKTGEAASFEAVSCASAGGPAFRVTLRGRFRDSFILYGLQPASLSQRDPRAHRHLRQVLAVEDLQLQCPANAELL